ncbi:MAG: hypothetical protein HY530_06000 [Chloroflexi bacterium]|nr:hypothetical protein [Chloroflexota bacterium]
MSMFTLIYPGLAAAIPGMLASFIIVKAKRQTVARPGQNIKEEQWLNRKR